MNHDQMMVREISKNVEYLLNLAEFTRKPSECDRLTRDQSRDPLRRTYRTARPVKDRMSRFSSRLCVKTRQDAFEKGLISRKRMPDNAAVSAFGRSRSLA